MPKMIYLGILFVLTLLVVAFAGMIREKQDRVSKSIFTLFVAVVVAVVANGIFIMTDEKAIATFLTLSFWHALTGCSCSCSAMSIFTRTMRKNRSNG